MVEAGECRREVEEEQCSERVGFDCAVNGLIDVDDVGGDVSVMEEAPLFWAAEFVGERCEDNIIMMRLSVLTTEIGHKLAGV